MTIISIVGVKMTHKFPINIMVWIGISEYGATQPYFLPPSKFKLPYI